MIRSRVRRTELADAKGAEVSGAALVVPSPGEVDAWELLFQVYLDVGICLVVLEADVVLGLVALDEGVFEDKGLALGIGDDVFVLGDARGQMPTLEGECGGVGEVGADAAAQARGLADVDNLAGGVPEDVDAGFSGGGLYLVCDRERRHYQVILACGLSTVDI